MGRTWGRQGRTKTERQYTDSTPTILYFLRCIADERELSQLGFEPGRHHEGSTPWICHISKSTALYVLRSGKIPCEYTCKRTCCYKIKKEYVIAYLKDRNVFPESYSAPTGWYSSSDPVKMQSEIPPSVREDIHGFYEKLLSIYLDVLLAEDIVKLIGYAKTTANNWCRRGFLKSFKKNGVNRIPKVYLIEFFCSHQFRTFIQKSHWHIYILKEFAWQKQLRAHDKI